MPRLAFTLILAVSCMLAGSNLVTADTNPTFLTSAISLCYRTRSNPMKHSCIFYRTRILRTQNLMTSSSFRSTMAADIAHAGD
jgi:hypothetical protein